MDRREFLKMTGATMAASSLITGGRLYAHQSAKAKVGLGLYTVRSEMEKGVADTLQAVSALGYGEVEFAGYYGHTAKEIKAMLADTGLVSPSTHVRLEGFGNDFETALDLATEVGHRYIILPYLQQEDRTLDRYKEIFDMLNVAGEKAKSRGMSVAYHNHAFEFEMVDGHQPYELLLERTDPELVKLQLDLYWLHVAGVDPLSLINRFPGRVPLVHVKDRTDSGDMVEVGAGVIDFKRIFDAAEKAGLEHYFVEHDRPEEPMQSIASSIQSLRATFPALF